MPDCTTWVLSRLLSRKLRPLGCHKRHVVNEIRRRRAVACGTPDIQKFDHEQPGLRLGLVAIIDPCEC